MIGGIHSYPVPDISDPSGFAIATDLVGVYFGPNARSVVYRAPRTRRFTPRTANPSVTWLDPNDKVPLRLAIRKFIEPRLSLSPAIEREASSPMPDDWKVGRALRAFAMLQVWAMLPLKKRLIAAGEGKAILAGELAQAEHRLGESCRGGDVQIHRDGVVHFLFGEMQRLGITMFGVPLIQLR